VPTRRNARDYGAHDEPAGWRRFDLKSMPHGDFEELVHRLVRVAYPDARHTDNPDSGADTLLPKVDGGWARAWQARRYSTKRVDWRSCEAALDAAVETYEVSRYTFVFAHGLSDTQTIRFDGRLKNRTAGVRVDYRDLSELLARMDETHFGQRIARLFFGPSREEYEAQMRDAFASGAADLKSADDVLGRLAAVASWLERNDPHFAYATHSWEVGQPQSPPAPGTVMSHIEIDDRTGRRIDARIRDGGDGRVPMPEVRVDFDPDQRGRRAFELLMDADRRNVAVTIRDGFSVTFKMVPDLWGDREDEPMRDVTLIMEPTLPATRAIDGMLRAWTAEGPVMIDITLQPVLRDEWHLAWAGTVGGLTVEFALREDAADRVVGSLGTRYELPAGGSARREREAVAFTIAAGAATQIELVPSGNPPVVFPVTERVPADVLRALGTVLEAMVVIEDWTGERIPTPSKFDEKATKILLTAAAMIQARGFTGTVSGVRYTLAGRISPDTIHDRGFRISLQQDYGIVVAGQAVWLGFIAYDLLGVKWNIETDEKGRTVLVIPSDDRKVVQGKLHRGKLEHTAVPDGWTATAVIEVHDDAPPRPVQPADSTDAPQQTLLGEPPPS
jgi:hypothetical protein